MSSKRSGVDSAAKIVERLQADVAALIQATTTAPPSSAVRRRMDAALRRLLMQVDGMLGELDPVRQPRFMFDPGNPAVVGRFIALAMIAQPRVPLPDIKPFYGSGVYALYYNGDFAAYSPVQGTETPIYVGKADPATDTAKRPIEQDQRLFARLRDHLRSIRKASSNLRADDFDHRCLVVQSGWQGAAEAYLIHLFKPAWNNETGICFGLGKHGDDPGTRANLRSPWDTVHRGREWAHRDPHMKDSRPIEEILVSLRNHFATTEIYQDLDSVIKGFFDELKQL